MDWWCALKGCQAIVRMLPGSFQVAERCVVCTNALLEAL